MWRRKATHRFQLQATLDQLEPLANTLESFLQQAQALPNPDSDRYMIKLAIHELVTNIMRHAYADQGGTIDVALSLKRSEFSATLTDSGLEFVPPPVTEPDFDNGQEGGYGIFLIEQLMDEVTYRRIADRNEWRLIKRW